MSTRPRSRGLCSTTSPAAALVAVTPNQHHSLPLASDESLGLMAWCLAAGAVVVADPHTDDGPHRHLIRLMEGPLAAKRRLLVVAHSYGAPCTLGMVRPALTLLS